MRITLALAIAMLGVSSSGCGASVAELLREGRVYEACSEVWLEEEEEETPDRALVREALWERHDGARVQVHAFTPEELEEALDYVPMGLRRKDFLLVMMTMSGDEASIRDLEPRLHVTGLERDCCEVEEWLHVDGRDDEIRRIRDAERAADARRERRSGPLGGFSALAEAFGGFVAGVGADLMYVGTLGIVDMDVSSLPTAQLSPIQMMRGVLREVTSHVPTDHEDVPDEHETEAQRRARTAAVLSSLVDNDGICRPSAGESHCQVVNLIELWDTSHLELAISMSANGEEDSGELCGLYDVYEVGPAEDLGAAINEAFREPMSLPEIAELSENN